MKGPRMLYPLSSKGAVCPLDLSPQSPGDGPCLEGAGSQRGSAFFCAAVPSPSPAPAPTVPTWASAVSTACVTASASSSRPAAGRPGRRLLSRTISL